MDGMNIKYEKGMVETKSGEISEYIEQNLAGKAAEYDSIGELLSISKGEVTEALKSELNAEKQAVLELAEFYKKVLEMIKKASNNLEEVETHYGNDHLGGGGAGR